MDNRRSDRPERTTALVARELSRYGIQIAALSETHLAEEGQLIEEGVSYTFYWSGKSTKSRRESGVRFAIKTNLIDKLADLPKAVSDRLMILRLQLDKNQRATLISVYAPTMMYSDEFKSRFYEELDSLTH